MSSIDLPTTISYTVVTLLCTSLESSPSLYTEWYANEVDRVPVQLRYPRRYRVHRACYSADSSVRTATLCKHTIYGKYNIFHTRHWLMTIVQTSFGLPRWMYFGSQNASSNRARLGPNDPGDELSADLPPLRDA